MSSENEEGVKAQKQETSAPSRAGDKSKRLRRRDGRPPVIREDDARELVTSLFFGFLPAPERDEKDTKTKRRSSATSKEKAAASKVQPPKQQSRHEKIMGALQLEEHIPTNAEQLREKPIFQSAQKLLQWQRDNYLVGKDYADWRKRERQEQPPLQLPAALANSSMLQQQQQQRHMIKQLLSIPIDPTALGHGQIAQLSAQFIPSDTVRLAALPLTVGLAQSSPAGALYQTSQTSLVNLIQGQQSRLDSLLQTTLLNYLQNPDNRVAIKNSTQGYIAARGRNSSSNKNQQKTS